MLSNYATPISVITAIQQASNHDIMVKGGKYLEIMSDCEVVVFDKTGTDFFFSNSY